MNPSRPRIWNVVKGGGGRQAAAVPNACASEGYLSAELTAARGNSDTVVLGGVIDLPEIISSKSLTRNSEAWVIQSINPVRAQLQMNSLPKSKALGDRQIEDGQARTSQNISSLIAEYEWRIGVRSPWVCEGGRVKPLVRVRIAYVR